MSLYLTVTATPDIDETTVSCTEGGGLQIRAGGLQSIVLLFDKEADFDLWVIGVRRRIAAAKAKGALPQHGYPWDVA